MKKAVSFFTFDQNVDISQACAHIASAGYDGVELCLSQDGSINMQTDEHQLCQFREMLQDLKLEVCSIGAWNNWSYNLAGMNPAEAEKAGDVAKKQIELAAAFGTDTILLVPGWVKCRFSPDITPYERAYENAQYRIAKLADFARDTGVTIAIENVGGRFLYSPLEMRRFIDEIASGHVGAYFDVGNIIGLGYPDQWIEILGKRIKRLHFCDAREGVPGLSRFVDLLEGDVDYYAVMDAIRKIGYDEWLTVEFLPNYKMFPYQSIYNARLSLDRILNECRKTK